MGYLEKTIQALWRIRALTWVAIFLPPLLLCYFFWQAHILFHTDDVSYWTLAHYWLAAFRTSPFSSALHAVYDWPTFRPSFHPLLGLPLLWAFGGSINASAIFIGLAFSVFISVCLLRIFVLCGISSRLAALATIAVTTFPHFLNLGRFFLSEYPFTAFCLAALLCLIQRRYFAFCLLYTFALLGRPIEGGLLTPAFFLFGFFLYRDAKELSWGKALTAVAVAGVAAGLAHSGRWHAVRDWVANSSFRQSGLHFWGNLKLNQETLAFASKLFFDLFGITGLAVVAGAMAMALKHRRQYTGMLFALFGMTMMVGAVFVLIGCFDNQITIDTAWRYSVSYVVFLAVFAVSVLALFAKEKTASLLFGGFFLGNLLVFAVSFPSRKIMEGSLLTRSVRYHREVVNSAFYQFGVPAVLENLTNLLGSPPQNILLAGRSGLLQHEDSTFQMRCVERKQGTCGQMVPGPAYVQELFRRQLQNGPANFRDFHIDAVLFARGGPGDLAQKAYPNEELVSALENGDAARVGLKKVGEIQTQFPQGPRVVEVFRAAGE